MIMTIRVSAILMFGLCLTPAFAQTLPGRDAGNGQHPRRQQQGFGEYALGKINPGNADLGAAYQTTRDQLVHATIDDVYFWSNCVSITLLIGVTGFCFLHLRASDKKERIAATLIGQLWNGRVSDKIEIERRTQTYNTLVDEHNELVERSLTTRSVQRKIRSTTKEEPEMEAPDIEMESATVEVPAPANMQVPLVEDFTPVEVPSRRDQPARRPVEVAPSLQKINPVDQQAMAQEQQIKRLRSQVQALQSREANLLVRINSQEELKKQNRSSQWKRNLDRKPGGAN
jgi:hypothetical protein